MPEMKKTAEFTIVRKTWLRGEGSEHSSLLRKKDKKKCCLGFYLEACGVSLGALRDKPSPTDIQPWRLPEETRWLLNGLWGSPLCGKLMEANDHEDANEKLREKRVIRLFKQRGIKVTFVDQVRP